MKDRFVGPRLAVAWICCCLTAVTSAAGGEGTDFRVETNVLTQGAAQPQSETKTYFVKDKVYDILLSHPQEIAILDLKQRRFELLDTARKVATHITCDDLLRFVAELQARGRQSKNALVRFAADPSFQEFYDSARGQVSLKSRVLIYEVATTTPSEPAMARRYHQFADWYARLNTTHPGALPPAARLRLNEILADKDVLPLSVRQQLFAGNRIVLDRRSDHVFALELQDADLAWVEQAESYRSAFRRIPFFEYRSTPHRGLGL